MLDTLGHSGKGPGRSWVEWMGVAHSRNGGELSARAERLHPGMRAFRFLGEDSIFGNSFSGAGHPPVDALGHSGKGPGRSWVEWMGVAHSRNGWELSARAERLHPGMQAFRFSVGRGGGFEPPLTPRKREEYNGPTLFCACYNDSGKG